MLVLVLPCACAKPAPAPSPASSPIPSPAAFEVASLNVTPLEVIAGETVSITAEVKNTGGSEGTYTTVLTINGASVETEEIALAAGASETVSFSLVKDTSGTYQVSIGGLTSSLTVKPAPAPSPAEFLLTSLDIVPEEVVAGEEATISARVKNIGGTEGTYTITLSVEGAKIQSKVIKLASEMTETVSFTVTKDKPGSCNVEINGLSSTFRVLKPAEFMFGNLLITPPIAEVNQGLTITADVNNTGEVEDRYKVTLIINGDKVETKELTISPGAIEKTSFAFTKDTAGSYKIEVGSLARLVIVVEKGNILAQLATAYPELCQEMLKLPDLQEVNDRDKEAIEDIAQLALDAKNKPALESIINEGIKDKRKYCTPLQALLWIAYDRDFYGYNPLRNFFIVSFVGDIWKTTTTSKNFASERWLNFIEVANRLNSPELIATYMQNNFSYSYTMGEDEGIKSAEQIFKDKKGACYDHALFAAYCLKKNGYDKAWGVKVTFDQLVKGCFIGHIGCIYQDPKDSLYYCTDFGTKGYTVYGPFSSIDEAAKLVCKVGSGGEAGLASYSLHDIDIETGKYKTTW